MAINCKKVRERVTKMNTAWAQSAAAVVDQEYADLLAQAKMKADERDALYEGVNSFV